MLNPGAIKKGDRFVWHKRSESGSYSVKDGHGATVRSWADSVDGGRNFTVDVTWDPGTTQINGGYDLVDFDREEKELEPISSVSDLLKGALHDKLFPAIEDVEEKKLVFRDYISNAWCDYMDKAEAKFQKTFGSLLDSALSVRWDRNIASAEALLQWHLDQGESLHQQDGLRAVFVNAERLVKEQGDEDDKT